MVVKGAGHDGAITDLGEAGAGGGRVKLVIQERSREYNAVQTGDEPIPTGTRVRVASTNPGSNRLIVERA